jgi:hypothetical protein
VTAQQVLGMVLATAGMADSASTEGFYTATPGSHVRVRAPGLELVLPPGQFLGIGSPAMQAGLGYDPLFRNSNTFIGTFLRAADLDGRVPQQLREAAVGFSSVFTDWTIWDLALQSYISSQI